MAGRAYSALPGSFGCEKERESGRLAGLGYSIGYSTGLLRLAWLIGLGYSTLTAFRFTGNLAASLLIAGESKRWSSLLWILDRG